MNDDIDIDALRREWRGLQEKLEAQHALGLQLLTENRIDRARARLRPLLAGQVLQMAIGGACTVFFARFWIAHADQPLALASGLLMHAWSVALLLSAAVETLLLVRINYAQPVLTVQRYLGLLQFWRTRRAPLLGLAFWVLWPLLVEVLSKHFTGADVGVRFLAVNVAVGIAGFAGTLWWFAHLRRHGHRVADAIDADNRGCGIEDARALLADVQRFRAG